MNTQFKEDYENLQLHILRTFSASQERVWDAWTRPELICQWWAPRPWTCEVASMDFSEGGTWLYAMCGPEGEKHWGAMVYQKINPKSRIEAKDAFCDENGKVNKEMPGSSMVIEFRAVSENETEVLVVSSFESIEAMKQLVEMGAKEGFAMAQDQLEEILQR
ncbi:MAG: SRPBCC domain-containing protein [Flavobacteriia bacterium]|nr:SRPBCC domain-containing protein [Flavobacteriia bacterium]